MKLVAKQIFRETSLYIYNRVDIRNRIICFSRDLCESLRENILANF